MSLVFADRVRETTATTGTGTVTLAGAVAGYQSFSVVGNGNKCFYRLESGDNWEIGIGTYTASGTTLSRDIILSSTNSGSAITLAGTSSVFLDIPADFYTGSPRLIRARVGSTANVSSLSSGLANGDVFNGVTLVTGNAIFLRHQSTGSENGVYICQASGAPIRSPLLPAGALADGTLVQVTEGTLYKDELYACTSNNTIVGTDATTWGSPVSYMTGDSGSGGMAGLVPAPAAGDAAAGKFLKADGTFAVPSGGTAQAYNYLRNSTFEFCSRWLDPATSTSRNDDTYGLDGWNCLSEGSTVHVKRDSGTNSLYACGLVNNNGSAKRIGINQLLEYADTFPLRGQTVTFQARVKCDESSKNIRIALVEWTGTADAPTSDIVNTWSSGTFTAGNFFISSNTTVIATTQIACTTGGTWYSGSVSGSVSASCKNLMVVIVSESTIGDEQALTIECPDLHVGASTQTFFPLAQATEELRCRRFVYSTYQDYLVGAKYSSTQVATQAFAFQTRMRAVPTSTFQGAASWTTTYPPGATQVGAYSRNDGAQITITGSPTFSASAVSKDRAFAYVIAGSSFSGTVGAIISMQFGTSTFILFDAEL